jgi:hypothetical protein
MKVQKEFYQWPLDLETKGSAILERRRQRTNKMRNKLRGQTKAEEEGRRGKRERKRRKKGYTKLCWFYDNFWWRKQFRCPDGSGSSKIANRVAPFVINK